MREAGGRRCGWIGWVGVGVGGKRWIRSGGRTIEGVVVPEVLEVNEEEVWVRFGFYSKGRRWMSVQRTTVFVGGFGCSLTVGFIMTDWRCLIDGLPVVLLFFPSFDG